MPKSESTKAYFNIIQGSKISLSANAVSLKKVLMSKIV